MICQCGARRWLDVFDVLLYFDFTSCRHYVAVLVAGVPRFLCLFSDLSEAASPVAERPLMVIIVSCSDWDCSLHVDVLQVVDKWSLIDTKTGCCCLQLDVFFHLLTVWVIAERFQIQCSGGISLCQEVPRQMYNTQPTESSTHSVYQTVW